MAGGWRRKEGKSLDASWSIVVSGRTQKILKLKEWLTLPDATRHLSIELEEEVSAADILQFGRKGHLKLSFYFANRSPGVLGTAISRDVKKGLVFPTWFGETRTVWLLDHTWKRLRKGRDRLHLINTGTRAKYVRTQEVALMMGQFVSNWLESVRRWWRAPVTNRDRIGGAFFGAVGFFFIGFVARAIVGARPVSFETLASWRIVCSSAGLIIGIRFPKVTTCLLSPILFIGW